VRLDDVGTHSLLAQWWEDDVPEWAEGDDGDLTIGFTPLPDSRLAVALSMLARDDQPRAVRADLIARYEVAVYEADSQPDEGNVEDTEKFLRSLPPQGLRMIANQALRDAAPYIRESIQSTSMRLSPDKPLLIPGGIPVLPDNLEMEEAL